MSILTGHTRQREALAKLHHEGKLPSALLLSGPTGIGKSLVARELAGMIFCEESEDRKSPGGCGECRSCRVFRAGNIPDFHYVHCDEKDEAAIDQIRELLYSLNLKAFSAKGRVVVFDDAERLSVQSSNVLLKSIEEPRGNTHFILISSNASKLLPTILSRCQEWRFDELSDEQVRAAFEQNPDILSSVTLSRKQLDELVTLCDGSLGNALSLSSHLDTWSDLSTSIERIASGEAGYVYELAGSLAKDRDNLRMNLQLMRIFSRRQMHAHDNGLMKYKWATMLTNLISAEGLIFERNLNSSLVLSSVFLALLSDNSLDAFFTLNDREHLVAKMTI